MPIECEGQLDQAVIKGIYKLVSSNFAFSLLHKGDCEYDIAGSPSESYAQIFIKLKSGRTVSSTVPIDKGNLGFVKALVCYNQNVLPHQHRFLLSKAQEGKAKDDSTSLRDCHVDAFSTLYVLDSLYEHEDDF